MSDIFFSYDHEDRGRAELLARALQSEGWSVWWDKTIPAGQKFDDVIERNLDAARCVVVLWSTQSVASEWVRTEAQEGENRRILVPVLIDNVKIPIAFRLIQAANLVGWQGDKTAPEYSQLVTDIKSVLAAHPNSNGSSTVNPVQSERVEVVGTGGPSEATPHSHQVEGLRGAAWYESRPVSKRDVQPVVELMRRFFGEETPTPSRMLEWQRRNKTVLTAVYVKKLKRGKIDKELVGVFKILPLTQQAVDLLESEQKTGATLKAQDIAKEGGEAAALYIGDVVASTRNGKAEVVRQLKHRVEPQIDLGVPVYTRPLTADGARLVRKYNFIPVMKEIPSGAPGRIHKLFRSSRKADHVNDDLQVNCMNN